MVHQHYQFFFGHMKKILCDYLTTDLIDIHMCILSTLK